MTNHPDNTNMPPLSSPPLQTIKPDSADQYRKLLDTATFPVVVTALDNHKVLYLNNSAAEYFQVDTSSAVGQTAADYWVNPEDRKKYIKHFKASGQVNNFETQLKTGNGKARHVLISGNIITFDEKPAISSVFHDITRQKIADEALRNSEEKYHELYNLMRMLADTVPDLIWAKDLMTGIFLPIKLSAKSS